MKVCNLASGSKGNATYLEVDGLHILIDNGLSLRELTKRLSLLGRSPSDIDYIFITHEHSDHMKGVRTFFKKFKAKLCICQESLDEFEKYGKLDYRDIFLINGQDFKINNLFIRPILLSHDSKKCYGYYFENNGKKLSILTDLGQTNSRILDSVKGSQLIYIEANHDINLLNNNPKYPPFLKRRILSSKGHLSNNACAEAITELVQHGTKQFVLSHLSEENNDIDVAYNTICEALKKYGIIEGQHLRIDISYQNKIGTVFNLK